MLVPAAWPGDQGGTIRACYVSNITATGGSGANVGSLVGDHFGGTLIASYAGGKDYGISLVGSVSGTVTNSYSQAATSSDDADKTVPAKTQSALQTPTGYTGIYADWNLDLNNDSTNDNPWDFDDGAGSADYPVLNGIDADADGTIDADDLAEQRN